MATNNDDWTCSQKQSACSLRNDFKMTFWRNLYDGIFRETFWYSARWYPFCFTQKDKNSLLLDDEMYSQRAFNLYYDLFHPNFSSSLGLNQNLMEYRTNFCCFTISSLLWWFSRWYFFLHHRCISSTRSNRLLSFAKLEPKSTPFAFFRMISIEYAKKLLSNAFYQLFLVFCNATLFCPFCFFTLRCELLRARNENDRYTYRVYSMQNRVRLSMSSSVWWLRLVRENFNA